MVVALVPVVLADSLSMSAIVEYQVQHGWFICWPPGPGLLAFVIYMIAALAESNRIPFDIPEAESELIAGVTVEYTSMYYGLLPMAEYLHTLIASALVSALFLGGWDGPFAPGVHWMILKTMALFVFIFWVRWSLVRFRSDQLMRICWVWLVPISLLTVCAAAVSVYFLEMGGAS